MTSAPDRLQDSTTRLVERFDVAMLDLDGVVYVGPDAVPGVPSALSAARDAGLALAFVTNNASRTPVDVAAHLRRLGIPARAEEVVTSSQAAARYLAERLPAAAPVLILGTQALADAVAERGLSPVWKAVDGATPVAAVVQGYSPKTDWPMLAEGAVAIGAGALWVATNADPTVPSPRGPLPGNGSLVAALRHATRHAPVITGKPDPTMHRETLLRTGADRPIVVGDRLDTDIEGANNVGCPSLLVFSGVTSVPDLLTAPAALRPTFVAEDAGGLLVSHPATELTGSTSRCGAWTASMTSRGLELASARSAGTADGTDDDEDGEDGEEVDRARDAAWLDAVRALCAAAWSVGPGTDDAGSDDEHLLPPVVAADDDHDAARALRRMGLGED